MLNVNVNNIIPVSKARANLDDVMNKVNGTDEIVVLTKSGQPKAAMVDPDLLGQLLRRERLGSFLGKNRRAFMNYLRYDLKMSERKIASLNDEDVMKILGLSY